MTLKRDQRGDGCGPPTMMMIAIAGYSLVMLVKLAKRRFFS